ncbi:MAG: ribonuclease Z [Spirochaetia bacterium]|nr:ribonuclease Z [Spirochaetia bacterium]
MSHEQNYIKKITIIGSGNAFNANGRACSAYLIETSFTVFLVDAGPTTLYRLRQMNFPTGRIDCIFFTHFHGDHIAGLPFLLLDMDIMQERRNELVLAGPPGLSEIWMKWYGLAYGDHKLRFPVKNMEIQSEEIEWRGIFIQPCKINHRPESIGFRFRDSAGKIFAYSGDSAFDSSLLALIDGADLAVIEMSMERNTNPPTAHVSRRELFEEKHRLNARRLILSHTTDEIAKRIDEIGEAAFDGMELLI